MRIESVEIRNFRPLKEVILAFDDVTTLIGPNGTGKSAVLRALDWFFNGGRADLSAEDCCHGAVDEDIEVQVTFGDLTDADRDELGKYAPEGAVAFTAWKKRTPEGAEYLSANAKGYPAFEELKSAANATAKREAYKALREARSELRLPAANTAPQVDEAIAAWEANNPGELEDVPEALQTNFFGFNSSGKMSGLFDYVFVTADMRAAEEAQDAKTSIIGRILERMVDRSAADEEIRAIVEQSRLAQQAVYAEKFNIQLEEMAGQLNTVVQTYAPGRLLRVVPSDIELKAARTTFDVSVLDGDTETGVERQGHGFQRTLLISALQMLARNGTAGTDGVICLAIEEPELYQHPIQAQAFARVLRALSEDPEQRIQVVYATHSPYFVDGERFSQVRRLTRADAGNRDVVVNSSSVEEVKAILDGVVRPDVVDRQLEGVVTGQLPIALFAERALVVEGTTEAGVMQGIADRSTVAGLEANGVCVLSGASKDGVPFAHAILTSLGIPTHALFDGDAGCGERAKANGRTDGDIRDLVASQAANNRRLMSYFGLNPTDFPPETDEEAVTILEDRLETVLDRDWPEWRVACSQYEEELGIVLRKNNAGYRTATLRATGSVPPILERVVERASGSRATAVLQPPAASGGSR